jgi:hypothetical protein
MIEDHEIEIYRQRIDQAVQQSADAFDEATRQVQALQAQFREIYPQAQQMVSLASDGGHSRLEINPFNLFIVRVVDSNSVEIMREIVAADSNTVELSRQQFDENGKPATALGCLMHDLDTTRLSDLTPMIQDQPESNGWVVVYRELCEWAALYQRLLYDTPTAPTVYVKDGLLRTKIFRNDNLMKLYANVNEAIERVWTQRRVRISLAGVAKHTEIVQYYELAMASVGGLPGGYPAYAPVPMDMQEEVYVWPEYIREPDDLRPGHEDPKYNIGSMHFVRFGPADGDRIWTVDVLHSQRQHAHDVLSALAADAQAGFPVPHYPLSLQRADEYAQIAGFDREILSEFMKDSVRCQLPADRSHVLDALALDSDITQRRYG